MPPVENGAIAGEDYTGLTGSVTFADGVGMVVLAIDPIDDALVEWNETVAITLTTAPGYTITGATATVSIIDNDEPAPAPTPVPPYPIPDPTPIPSPIPPYPI